MGTPLRELQELLRIKDERIAELEAVVCCRDAEIQELRSHLDKFLSILPFSAAPPLTPTKPRTRDRAQGISAEPPLQELAPLAVVDKSDRRMNKKKDITIAVSPLYPYPNCYPCLHHTGSCHLRWLIMAMDLKIAPRHDLAGFVRATREYFYRVGTSTNSEIASSKLA
ncbi:cGMP-dependent protein kinase 1 [Atta colombica]|uniref:cGMP-dependent protein kinase 1 n=1 Tax=Atta colombica TaxID=520822 RepID=A0A195BS70_9HYME|nr:cGMP-dependent protein kinase 1 [Atta colombica]